MTRRRITCPRCLNVTSATDYERNGCWACTLKVEQEADDARFAEFMAQDEETRWRTIFDALAALGVKL